MNDATPVQKFASIFKGYEASFVKHVPPFRLEEETGKRKGWVGVAKYGTSNPRVPTPPELTDDDYIPVTFSKYEEHLRGGDGLAVSPLFDKMEGRKVVQRNVCYFGVIDIDSYTGDFVGLINRLYSFGYKFSPFISKSNGLHMYFIFSEAESAAEVRKALHKIVEVFGLDKIYKDGTGKSKVEVFPEHDTRKKDVHDKYVFLPFYNAADKTAVEGKLLTSEGKARGLEKALVDIENMFTSVDEINTATGKLPLADAPYCVQMLTISGNSSHRNDFLFTSALYLKTKHGEGFTRQHLEELNNMFEIPLEDHEVQSCFSSATSEKYANMSIFGRCKTQPVCEVCDKSLCKLREFGVGREKNNVVLNVEFGKLIRVLAEDPYYLWEARLAGSEEYKLLRIDGAENLLNQAVAQKACINALNAVPYSVTKPTWEKLVNNCLANIEERAAPKATDTSDLAELRENFNRYLTHRKAKNNPPYTVNVKQVYYKDGFYFFKTDGFQDFLRSRNFKLGRLNLREELLRYGCEEATIMWTTTNDQQKVIECWKKVEDEHLKKLDSFYDDVMDADTAMLSDNKLNKQDAAAVPEDTRF
jgi:hypothetical protein